MSDPNKKDVVEIRARIYNKPAVNGVFEGTCREIRIPVQTMRREEALRVSDILHGNPLVSQVWCFVAGGGHI